MAGLKFNTCKNCGASIHPSDKYCPRCGTAFGREQYWPNLRNVLPRVYGPPKIKSTETKSKRCKNCDARMDSEDKYCTKCGVIYGKGSYSPDEWGICVSEVYGPPPRKRVHKCESCNYTWNSFDMIDNVHYCPRCGGNAQLISEER